MPISYDIKSQGKNKIINGDLSVDLRNAGGSQTITAGAALAYTVDRWFAWCTGANVTGQQLTTSSTDQQYKYQFTGATSVTAINFAQRIESIYCYGLAGKTCTLSLDMANSLLTTVTWTANYANTADTFGSIASPTKTQIATGTFTVSSTDTTYSVQIDMPTNAVNGIEIVFSVGAQTSGTWGIEGVQLEVGTSATTFDYRFNEELLCQRYLPRWDSVVNGYYTFGQSYSTSQVLLSLAYKVPPRVLPTGITTSAAGDFVVSTPAGSNVTASSISYSGNTSINSLALTLAATTASLVAGNVTILASGAGAATFIQADGCEL